MDYLKVIHDNSEAINGSFLYYLHECDEFKQSKLNELCNAIVTLGSCHEHGQEMAREITFIYGQILKHIIYHFDPSDGSCIKDLPANFGDNLEKLDSALNNFFSK